MNWQAEIESNCFIIEYEIERICFGSPGRIREWVRWGSFKTESERDDELKRLRKSGTERAYRGRDFHPWENRRIAY